MRRSTIIGALATATLAASPAVAAAAPSHGLGLLPSPHPVGHIAHSARSISSVPDNVDLRQFAMIPGDQGQVSSCAAWGTAYTAMGLLENRDRGSSQFENPSNIWSVGGMAPMYAYSQTHQSGDGGSYIKDNLDIATSQGIDDQFDYWQGNADWQDTPTSSETARARNWRVASYQSIPPDQEDIEAALAAGQPVVIGIQVTQAFIDNTTGNYPDDNNSSDDSTSLGGHAPTAVGYDQDGLIVENSWGPFWDNAGYVHISWDWLTSSSTDSSEGNLSEAYAVVRLQHYSPAPPPPPPAPTPAKPKFTKVPARATRSHTAGFRWSDSTRGVKYQIRLGNGRWVTTTSPRRVLRNLKHGRQTFSVRAVKGQKISATITFRWTVKR